MFVTLRPDLVSGLKLTSSKPPLATSSVPVATSVVARLDDGLVPQGFPQGLPLEYKVKILENYNEKSGAGAVLTGRRVYLSQHSVLENYTDFKDFFERGGWTITDFAGASETARGILVTNANWYGEITATSSASEATSTVGVMATSSTSTVAAVNPTAPVTVAITFRAGVRPTGILLPSFIESRPVAAAMTNAVNTTTPSAPARPINTAPVLPPAPFQVNLQVATSNTPVAWDKTLSVSAPGLVSLRVAIAAVPAGERYAAAFWCNAASATTEAQTLPPPNRSLGGVYDGNLITVSDVCKYPAGGKYTPKVIIGALGSRAEARANVDVISPTLNTKVPGTVIVPVATSTTSLTACTFGAAPVKTGSGGVQIKWNCPNPEYACTISPPATSAASAANGVVTVSPRWTTAYTVQCALGTRTESATIKVMGESL